MADNADHIDSHDRGALVRSAMMNLPDGFVWPSTETILAYLEGTATEAQKSAMTVALDRSPEFQRILIELSNYLEELADPHVAEDFDRVPVPELPRVQAFLEKEYPPASGLFNRIMHKFGAIAADLFTPRVFIPALGTAAVAIIVIIIIPPGGPEPLKLYASLDPGLFAAGELKGEQGGPDSVAFSTPDTAAYAIFKQGVSFDYNSETGQFTYSIADLPHLDQGARRVVVRLLDKDNNSVLGLFTTGIPYSDGNESSAPVEAWILAIPSCEIWHFEMKKDSVDAFWGSGSEIGGCMTFTHLQADGYHATEVVPFGFAENSKLSK